MWRTRAGHNVRGAFASAGNAPSARVVAEVVVEADRFDLARLQERDGLLSTEESRLDGRTMGLDGVPSPRACAGTRMDAILPP